MSIDSYDIFIIDCDGVIFDSNQKKINLFLACLKNYESSSLEIFASFLNNNFGKTRRFIFNYFFEKIIKRDKDKIENILLLYGKECVKMYLNSNFTDGFEDFLIRNKNKKIYIVSGNDQEELKKVFLMKCNNYKFEILGSPVDKNTHFLKILNDNPNKKVLSIGDSEYDYRISKQNDVDFLFMKDYSLVDLTEKYNINSINSFKDII